MPQYKLLKKEGKLWTYTYADNSKAQIDYVFINKKWKNSNELRGILLFRVGPI